MPEPALALAGVGRRYGEREALAGVTVEVREGQTLGVFGPNGAGKTTLLRVLATLLRPHSGSAQVLGGELPDGSCVTPKYVGRRRLIEIAVATLATSSSRREIVLMCKSSWPQQRFDLVVLAGHFPADHGDRDQAGRIELGEVA